MAVAIYIYRTRTWPALVYVKWLLSDRVLVRLLLYKNSEREKEYQTLSWLRCNKTTEPGQKYIELLWCTACRKFEDKIRGVKNFSTAWIAGSANQKLSNVTDHAKSDQHIKLSMSLMSADQAKARNKPITSYAPIARSLLVMDKTLEEKMCKKFDICYLLPKENLAFRIRKYPAIHELETRHGIDLGQKYAIKDSAKTFTHFIADSQCSAFLESLSTAHFFSFLMDGTTDAGKIEDELVVIMTFCR